MRRHNVIFFVTALFATIAVRAFTYGFALANLSAPPFFTALPVSVIGIVQHVMWAMFFTAADELMFGPGPGQHAPVPARVNLRSWRQPRG